MTPPPPIPPTPTKASGKTIAVFACAALVLLAALGTRVVKVLRVQRDSNVSYEFALVRAHLAGCFQDHGRYPDQLGDTVEYNGEDLRLHHREDLVYIPSDDRQSFELRWNLLSEEGVSVYEKWENGNLAEKGQTRETAP
jgi:hypothetical protein